MCSSAQVLRDGLVAVVAVNEDEVEAAVGHVHRRFDGELPPQLGARREAREDLAHGTRMIQ